MEVTWGKYSYPFVVGAPCDFHKFRYQPATGSVITTPSIPHGEEREKIFRCPEERERRLFLFLYELKNQVNDKNHPEGQHAPGELCIITMKKLFLGMEEVPHGRQNNVPCA